MPALLIVFVISVVLSIGAVSLILKLSHRKGWYDHIDERKIHTGEVPRLGGIGFAAAFFAVTAVIAVRYGSIDAVLRFLPCIAAMIIALCSGAYDDFRPMLPRTKMLLQFIAALCVIIPGFTFDRILNVGGGFLTDLGFLAYPVTFLWIVGLTNAFNLIDGVDGLAGGISAIIAFFLGLIFITINIANNTAGVTTKSILLCTCLFGVLIGFLFFNAPAPKAKIFMGDCGSQFLGFTLSLLPLMKETGDIVSMPVLYAAALFAIPIFDTTAAVWRRLRDGRKIYDPDKSHLHHKLINLGLGAKGVNAVLYSLQIILGTLIFISVRLEGASSLFVLGAAYLIALAFFTVIHFMNRSVMRKGTVDAELSDMEGKTITPPTPI
jgi:UDP-GlcNAc:undecaprenyl-phosphate GlcNAc-1-phosphate transferase